MAEQHFDFISSASKYIVTERRLSQAAGEEASWSQFCSNISPALWEILGQRGLAFYRK
jgi:hypothetical protein